MELYLLVGKPMTARRLNRALATSADDGGMSGAGFSRSLVDEMLQAGTITAAAGELFAILQDHDILAADARLQFLDLANIGDG